MTQYKPIRAIISGGGTGGHIFPAVSIAHKLKELNPETEILFVGAKGKMEMEKVPAEGFEIVGLPIVGMQRQLSLKNIWNDLQVPFKVLSSIGKARKIVRKFKPDIAVGVGGYASAPLLWAASGMKVPCLIQEQNGLQVPQTRSWQSASAVFASHTKVWKGSSLPIKSSFPATLSVRR